MIGRALSDEREAILLPEMRNEFICHDRAAQPGTYDNDFSHVTPPKCLADCCIKPPSRPCRLFDQFSANRRDGVDLYTWLRIFAIMNINSMAAKAESAAELLKSLANRHR